MKDKLLQFFTGKMSKAVYISIASAVVCGAVVITSTVIVHNNNQKIDSMQESLSALQENITVSASESVTESVSDADNTELNAQAKAPNDEPAGDKALQYLAEYDKLTAEYEKKRAELEKQTNITISGKNYALSPEPKPLPLRNFDTEEEYQQHLKKIENEHKLWEVESQKVESQKAEDQRKANEVKKKAEEARKALETLDAQYEKDVAALKVRYGIS